MSVLKSSSMGYFYILSCIFMTVYGQLVLKWRINRYGELPEGLHEKFGFFAKALLDPFILSGLCAAFAASLFWMAAMTKFEISFAYPFMSLAFVLVFVFSVALFGETVTPQKTAGVLLIVAGILVTSFSPS